MQDAPLRLPTVQLLHELPDGSAHVDWMIAPDAHGRERLVTFRLPRRVDELCPAAQADRVLEAERIADHRVIYLDYEGPLGGAPDTPGRSGTSAIPAPRQDVRDRGSVRRLRRGWVVRWDRGAEAWEMSVNWQGDDGPQRIRVEHIEGARWRIIR